MSYSASEHHDRPWCPPVDVYRSEHHYVVKADLPGMRKDAIKVKTNDTTLAISGTREFKAGEEAEEHLRLERLHGKFICEVNLPGIASNANLAINYSEGVLEIEVPLK